MPDTSAWLVLGPAAATTSVSIAALWLQARANTRALRENSRRAANDRRQQRTEKVYLQLIEALSSQEYLGFLAVTRTVGAEAYIAQTKALLEGHLVQLPPELVAFGSDDLRRLIQELQVVQTDLTFMTMRANTNLEEAKTRGSGSGDPPPVGFDFQEIRASYGKIVTLAEQVIDQIRTELREA
jgi:hypothetical protein